MDHKKEDVRNAALVDSFEQLFLIINEQHRSFATAQEIAQFLEIDATIIVNIAKRDPDYLGFPISFLGDSVRIPIIPFLKWATGASFKRLMGAATVQKPHESGTTDDRNNLNRSLLRDAALSRFVKIEDNESSKLITLCMSKVDYERLLWVAEKTEKNPIELVSRAVRMWIRSKYRVMNPPTCSDIQL